MVNKMPWAALKKKLEQQINIQATVIKTYENETHEILQVSYLCYILQNITLHQQVPVATETTHTEIKQENGHSMEGDSIYE